MNESSLPREPEANHTSGKYDVTIRSAAVKSRAHLEPVFSNIDIVIVEHENSM